MKRIRRPYNWLALAVIAATIIPAFTAAQTTTEPPVVVLKSGLFTVFPGHSLQATVAEVGSAISASDVTVEFRDAADQQRGVTSGTLLRNRPVQAQVFVPSGGARQLIRAVVKIKGVADVEHSEPIVNLEDLNLALVEVDTKPPCAPLPSPGRKSEALCTGWSMSWLTLQ